MEKKGKNEPAWDRKNEKENIFTIVWVRTFEYVTDPELIKEKDWFSDWLTDLGHKPNF